MKNSFRQFIEKRFTILVIFTLIISLSTIAVIYTTTSDSINNLFEPVQELVLIPTLQEYADTLFEASVYADNVEENGTSSVNLLSNDGSQISYSYNIGDGIEYPYAGLSLWANTNSPTIDDSMDLSQYTHVRLLLKSENSRSDMFIIKPYIPGITTRSNSDSHGYFGTQISFVDGVYEGELSLTDDLATPDWWYANNNTSKSECPAADFSKVIEIIFQNDSRYIAGNEVTITIEKIEFIKKPSSEIAQKEEMFVNDMVRNIVTTILLMLLILILFSSMKFIKTEAKDDDDSEKIIISYDRVEIEEEQNNDLQRITEYIASNYANPDFSVEQLAKGAGVSTSKIPTLLKKQYSMNFKQYLNTVRITEAKRLLLESEHQIVTIAHSVGYNNIPHFNRTFKQVTGLSPKKYREDPGAAIDNLPGSTTTK